MVIRGQGNLNVRVTKGNVNANKRLHKSIVRITFESQ